MSLWQHRICENTFQFSITQSVFKTTLELSDALASYINDSCNITKDRKQMLEKSEMNLTNRWRLLYNIKTTMFF